MKFLDIFPIGVGLQKLDSLSTQVIQQTIELIDRSALVEGGGAGSYTQEQNFLDHAQLAEVKQEVIDVCIKFSRGYAHEVRNIGICNSWANVVTKGQGIPPHQHNNSYISGSFYLTEGSALSITNPLFLDLFGFMPRVIDNNPRSYASYMIKPEPGMVVVFPSRLQHGVSQSRSDLKRYSIAFNAVPLGVVGVPTSLLDLRTN